jgi:DNA uptake protein ComE-like DNA-binding protein
MKVSKKKSSSAGNPELYRGKAKLAKDAKVVNINDATKEELVAIGINDQTARNIVNWRKKNGGYLSLEDLMLVPRFGKGCMAVFGPMLRV